MSRRSRRALLAAENLSNEARAVSDSVPCVESEGVTPSRDSLQALMSCLAHINHARRASTLQLASRALSLAADVSLACIILSNEVQLTLYCVDGVDQGA